MPQVSIHEGPCLEIISSFRDESFDSCSSDVPYGLGTHDPGLEEILAYLNGAEMDTRGDFKNTKWFIPSLAVWREVYRVLKPGAYLTAFGGTRTADLISLGIRAAGFEKRDELGCNLPTLRWVRGKGMPKSKKVNNDPATGTGLRPLWEPIMLFRKPLAARSPTSKARLTLEKNVQLHGTGALNIEGCRVKHASEEDFLKHHEQVERIRAKGGTMGNSWKNSSDLAGASEVSAAGRWPPNAVYVHSTACVKHGTKRVKGSTASTKSHEAYEGTSSTGFLRGKSVPGQNQHGDSRGNETVESWTCAEDCPVAALDRGQTAPPSRIFPCFEADPFMYCFGSQAEHTLGGRLENEHFNRKPLRLMQWLVRLTTPKGGRVLDPYVGSGTTLHAAYLEGFDSVGIDYWDVAIKIARKRMALVEQDASLEDTAESIEDLCRTLAGSPV